MKTDKNIFLIIIHLKYYICYNILSFTTPDHLKSRTLPKIIGENASRSRIEDNTSTELMSKTNGRVGRIESALELTDKNIVGLNNIPHDGLNVIKSERMVGAWIENDPIISMSPDNNGHASGRIA